MPLRHWTVYCDGSAMPNPGRMGAGAVITAPDGTRHTLSHASHAIGCNNEAELRALTLALEDLKARGAASVLVYTDNSILVEQLGATGARPIARMAGLFDDARLLLASFEEASLRWVPRHRNHEADALARASLGFAPKPPVRAAKKKR